jgi:DNA-binding transcriptional regulator LsrR (DeoR family)
MSTSSRRSTPRPATFDEQLLMADVARRHFWSGRTRIEIADELGLSRFKVGRLLETAISSGLVRIEINLPASVDSDLSLRLKERFGLDRALVTAPKNETPEGIRDALGLAAAALLSDLVTEDDVLGVTSGRTIDATARHLTSLAGCEIVQLTGMSGNLNDNPVEVLRRVAEVSGGQAHSIYAPLTVATAEAAAALRSDTRISSAFGRFAAVTIAVASVGCWRPPDSRFFDGISPSEREDLLAQDVIADVGGALLDSRGRAVHSFDDRILGLGLDELAAVDQVIIVAGGERKAPAIRATLEAGVVGTLITDNTVARRLLG